MNIDYAVLEDVIGTLTSGDSRTALKQLSSFLHSLEKGPTDQPEIDGHAAEVKALHDTANQVLVRLDALKVGARHTGSEYEMIAKIHDLAVGLGAECECSDGSKSAGGDDSMSGTNNGRLAAKLNELIDGLVTKSRTRPKVIEGVNSAGFKELLEGNPVVVTADELKGWAVALKADHEALLALAVEDGILHEEQDETAAAEDEPEEDETADEDAPGDGQKALSLWEIENRAWDQLWEMLTPQPITSDDWWLVGTYPEYAIVEIDGIYWKVPFEVTDSDVVLVPRQQWTRVAKDWVDAKHLASTTIAFGGEIKTLGEGKIGGYLVRFTSPDDPDLTGDYFDANTDYGPHTRSIVFYDHGLDEVLGVKKLGGKSGILGELKTDDVGVWVEAQLDLRDEYEKAIYGLAQNNKVGWSSGTATHLVKRVPIKGGKAHYISHWPLGLDASITPTPAEPRNAVLAGKTVPLKVYQQQVAATAPSLKALIQAAGEATKTSATAGDDDPATDTDSHIEEDLLMDKEELKALLNEVVDAKLGPVVDDLKSVKQALHEEPAANGVGFDFGEDGKADGGPTFKAFYQARFNGLKDDDLKHVIMDEVSGGNYKRFLWEQNAAFAKYVRGGTELMERAEIKLLKQQMFAPLHIMHFIRQGEELKAIKDTMVEAQGTLGGYAVPPNMQENIATRLPGLTAVRGNGARVIVLARSNSTEVPKYSGGDDRYVGNLRGQWGSETQSPTEQNATLEQDTLVANIYTYKIPMSQSLVEDASNLVELVEGDIIDTLAIDEDEVFLIGDGVGKPLGMLPGGLNSHALREVVSLAAAALTTTGVKKLKRGVATQYRNRGTWIANSDTYAAIENLTVSGTGSDFAFPDLSEEDRLLRRPITESEAMPDIAAGTFPIIFGDMGAYWIVEKPGLTVARFQDSATGINKVELHVRKRVGGRPVELWRLAVQKVAAS